jgi:LETM1 and EF-hand domain-containing protein 1, mitochondrial
MRESQRIMYDFGKFLPFSLFLIIPGLEVLLPLYLMLFPNSIPTWYIFDHVWDNQIEKLEIK